MITSEIDDVLYVPGTFKCAKCGFQLQVCVMDAGSGELRASTQHEPRGCPNDGEAMERVTWEAAAKECAKACNNLMTALAESVKLQSGYASLLNTWDGGNRMQFASPADWMNRLTEMGILER